MTLTVILGIIVAISIAIILWANQDFWTRDWAMMIGILVLILSMVALAINFAVYIPSKKDSEIKYLQLLQEKSSIEQMIATNKDVDRLLLNERVVEYNNKIISYRINSKRLVFREYYSKDIDWDSLEVIQWQ